MFDPTAGIVDLLHGVEELKISSRLFQPDQPSSRMTKIRRIDDDYVMRLLVRRSQVVCHYNQLLSEQREAESSHAQADEEAARKLREISAAANAMTAIISYELVRLKLINGNRDFAVDKDWVLWGFPPVDSRSS